MQTLQWCECGSERGILEDSSGRWVGILTTSLVCHTLHKYYSGLNIVCVYWSGSEAREESGNSLLAQKHDKIRI